MPEGSRSPSELSALTGFCYFVIFLLKALPHIGHFPSDRSGSDHGRAH